MSHVLFIEETIGGYQELVDAIDVCTDTCARTYARRIDVPYRGWNGAHEVETTTWCANCGVVLPGFDDDFSHDPCVEQSANVVLARFRSEDGEKCDRHNGAHVIQQPSRNLIDG